VTLKGDVFDPAGTLTGGATPAGGSVLLALQELNDAQLRLTAAEASHATAMASLAKMNTAEAAVGSKRSCDVHCVFSTL
jgi:chromosome segregation ATPase